MQDIFRCILCKNEFSEISAEEHVLLNALGGRLTAKRTICTACNHEMGNGADRDLAESTAFLRNACKLKAGDGDNAPTLRRLETDGESFDVLPGMQQRVRARKPMDIRIDDRDVFINIEAHSEEQAQKLVLGAATKIAKQLGYNDPRVTEAIKKDILKDRKAAFHPVPAIRQTIEFGAGRSQQSMAKACLVLWAMRVTSEEVVATKYDNIRDFIKTGTKETDPQKSMKADTRPLPALPNEFGDNPNLVWAGSDKSGRVYGYFRLYGAIGWRSLLCEKSAPPSLEICLVSNPFDNRMWRLFEESDSPVRYGWVSAEWNSWPVQFDKVKQKIGGMIEYAREMSQRDWLLRLISEGLSEAGCAEGEVITEEHVKAASDYVSRAVAALILKRDIPSR